MAPAESKTFVFVFCLASIIHVPGAHWDPQTGSAHCAPVGIGVGVAATRPTTEHRCLPRTPFFEVWCSKNYFRWHQFAGIASLIWVWICEKEGSYVVFDFRMPFSSV